MKRQVKTSNIMKKIISVFLILTSLFLLFSCSDEEDRAYDEVVVTEKAKSLIRRAEKLNYILWGEGIRYIEDDSNSAGVYYPADSLHLDELGFKDLAEIKDAAADIYSSKYYKQIENSVFSSKVGNYDIAGFVRYYDDIGILMVYSEYSPLLIDEVKYLYDTVRAVCSEGQRVKIEVTVEITKAAEKEGEEEKKQTRPITFYIVEEGGKWKIDSPTYASYRSDLEK